MTIQNEGETPTLEAVLRNAIDARLLDVHTGMPGIVEKYYPDKQTADVTPALKRKYSDSKIVTLPIISDVPVVFPRTNGFIIHFPLKKGDSVWLAFSERSIDNWTQKGGIVDPEDVRRHHLSDAVCFPGAYSQADKLSIEEPESLSIQGPKSVIQMRGDGSFQIKNEGGGSVVVTKDGEIDLNGSSKAVAVAESVESRLSKLESGLSQLITDVTTFATAYDAHMHPTAAPGPPSPPAAPAVPPSPFVADTSVVASSTVKVKP